MRHVDFDPQRLTGEQKEWWTEWEKRAAQATQEAIELWERERKIKSEEFDSSVWGDLKDWLFKNVFHDKCAYCETPIVRTSGHAEHFRPKGGVNYKMEDKKGKPHFIRASTKDADGHEIDHPGYFWLAYDWKNLLPSCEFCNAAMGKKNQFPCESSHILFMALAENDLPTLARPPYKSSSFQGKYYLNPEDLNTAEKPDLLHPYFDDPSRHIVFGHAGIEAPVLDENGQPSRKGKASIEVYNLKDPTLREQRAKAQRAAYRQFMTEYDNQYDLGKTHEECCELARQKMENYIEGREAYSAAALDSLRDRLKGFGAIQI